MSILLNPEKPKLDIVLVHGLNVWSSPTHADDTWTSGPPDDRVHWVRDFLPLHEETSHARVLVYSYNACAVFGAATTGVVAQAENLLNWLSLERQGFTSRPLVFIAHSMGGLIVKEALVQAREGSGKFAPIWYFTTGIMFFGTPHRGVDTKMYTVLANILRTISSDPDPGFLSSLEQYSGESERLDERFSTLLEKYQFVSVYETRPHRIKSLGIVVPRVSALLGLPEDHETRIPLDCDHNQICKFHREDEDGFRYVFDALTKLCKKAIASFIHPANSSAPEYNVAGFDSAIKKDTDGQNFIDEGIRRAKRLLQSTQTTTTVNAIDEDIRAHHSQTNSIATLSLIPQVVALIPILGFLLQLGLLLGRYLVPGIQNIVGLITSGLEDVETEQGHVFNLSRLNIQLLQDRLQATLSEKQSLETHQSAVPMNPGKEIELRELLARLDMHSEELVREIHRRQPAAEGAHRRVQMTEDFKRELLQARESQGESWLSWLWSLVKRLLTYLLSWVVEIG